MRADPKCAEKTVKWSVSFYAFGTSVKAVRKMLMKSTPHDFWKSVRKCYGTGKFVFSRDLKVTIIADL